MAEASTPGVRERRRSMDDPVNLSGLRLVLVGKTGEGKSSSGNTILGGERFKAAAGHSSVTSGCTKQSGEVWGRQVTIVDTPGLLDTSLPENTGEREISKCINMSAPGPHAILLVIKVGSFTAEDQKAVQKVEQVFGKDAWKYTILLFTHGDQVQGDFGEMLKDAGAEMKEILRKVNNRHHLFNNHKANERRQVLDLLKKVEKMVAANGGGFYSSDTYRQVMEMLDQREKRLRETYQKKLKEEVKDVEAKYQKKLEEARQERQQVEEELQCELRELRRYYKALEGGVRYVVEQIAKTDPVEKILKEFHEKLRLN